MKKIISAILLMPLIIGLGCKNQDNGKQAIAESPLVEKKLLSDTAFLGFRFGMSTKDAQLQLHKLQRKGEKINLTENGDELVGLYILNNGQYNVKSQLTIIFKKDRLAQILIKIKTDETNDYSATKILKDLADYFATFHGDYITAEDKDGFDNYSWKDGNRNIEIYQSDWQVKAKRAYTVFMRDNNLFEAR